MKSTTSEVILPEYIEVNDIKIECQREIKLLGICIDNKLKFNEQIEHICSKANVQLKIINYCPIVWHYCDIRMMRKMEKVQVLTCCTSEE